MSLLPVEEALRRILENVEPLEAETVAINDAHGRYLAEDVFALRTQPPFDASAMDGYAVRAADIAAPPASLSIIGEAPAGHGFSGSVGPGETVRIFTGAPVPEGADAILIQENTRRDSDTSVTALESVSEGTYIRPAGLDFALGQSLLKSGDRIGYREIALAAAMNHGDLKVRRKPRIAVLATGDELVPPGTEPGPDQIVASNGYAICAHIEETGGTAIDLGIVRDEIDATVTAMRRAIDEKADILITIGGASVGDHDLVQDALGDIGFELGFWRIAMRPGKPLMFGQIGPMRVLGFPGNPVSSIVCSRLFLAPLIRALLGSGDVTPRVEPAVLGAQVSGNDQRQDYLRATLSFDKTGRTIATPVSFQDSSLLATLVTADALLIRPPFAPEAGIGEQCSIIRL